MAKPNYAFAKRQRELAKKQKKEAKKLRNAAPEPQPESQPAEGNPPRPPEGEPS